MYYLYLLARYLALRLPRRLCFFIASCLATMQFIFSFRDRREVLYNMLPLAHSRKEAYLYTWNMFKNFAFYLVDFFRLARVNEEFIKKYVKIEGKEYLDKLVSEKKGVVVLTAHLGNYELGGAILSFLRYPFYAVALPHKDPRINKFFNEQRSIFKVKIVPTGGAIKRCLRLLKEGCLVAFLGDRDFTSAKGEVVSMCGREAVLPRGPAYFASRTGAYILPVFFVRDRRYYYRLIVEKPLLPKGPGTSLKEIVQEYSGILERYIRQYPEQWYMFRKFWGS